MMMNPNILNKNLLMFFDRAVNAQRSQLLTVMAEAVSECRTAADQTAELNETGQVGLLRLAEVWSAIRAKEGMGGLILEGTEAKILSDVVAQFYAYPHSAAYASEHGEMAQYNLSYQANSACKEAIEQTISAHYAENRLDTEAAVKDVLEKFGTERVQFILANTIQRKNYDGRISQDNKAWAKNIPTLEDSGASRHCAYLVVDQVNPGLTDLFTRQFRKVAQEQQKSSVLQKLKQELPAHKSAASKKREPER